MILPSRTALALVLTFFVSTAAIAQDTPGMIYGTIRNEKGNPMGDVKVDLIQREYDASTVSDPSGSFILYLVQPGSTEIFFSHSSTVSTGKYKVVFSPGEIIHLNVDLLRWATQDQKKDRWTVRETAGAPSVWSTEKVFTAEWIDLFPNTLHLWNFLSSMESSLITDRYDVSGMHGNHQPLLGVRGSSYTQNQCSINGLSFSDSLGEGMLAFPDVMAMETIVYTVGNSPDQHMGGGAHLSMIPKTGSRKTHGQAQVFFQSGALQNVNPTDRWRFFGITDSDERWRHAVDTGFQLGGPLGGSTWTYLGTVSLRDHEKYIREHILPVSSRVLQETLHLSGEPSVRDRMSLYWSGQQLRESEANASPQITREASLDQDRQYQTLITAWTRRLSAKSLVDTRFGIVSGRIRSKPQPEVNKQSRTELFPGFALYGVSDQIPVLEMVDRLYNTISGAPPLITDSDTLAVEGKAGFSTIRKGFRNWNHQISAGAGFRHISIAQKHSAIDNVNLLFFEEMPESVLLLNTPVRTDDRIHQLELHAADTISASRMSLNFGAYASFSNGANIMSSGATENSLNWNSLSWRVGVAYAFRERHPIVVRGGFARIYDQPLARTWSAVNPDGMGFRRYSWEDINGDLQYQPGEALGILKVYGAPYTQLDPGLSNPYTNQVTLGFTSEFAPWITLQMSGFHRNEKNLISLVNKGVPLSSYTPVRVWDPGPDGDLNSGEDDSEVIAYNQDPATLGKDRYLLTNPAGHSGYSQGFELRLLLTVNKFQAEASAMRYRAVAATAQGMLAFENDTTALLGIFDDPNKGILAEGSTYFDRGTVGRFHATHEVGRGIRLSVALSYLDGLPYGRYLPIKGFNQGVFGILVNQRGPGRANSVGGYRTVHYRNFDLRLTKEFGLGAGRMTAVLDVFNIQNRAEALVQTDVTAPTHLYRIPLRFQTPRSIQLGMDYRW